MIVCEVIIHCDLARGVAQHTGDILIGDNVGDWRQRYRLIEGDWPHPDSREGRSMSCHDYHQTERLQRAENVLQALWLAKTYLPSAVMKETGEALDEALEGVVSAVLISLVVVATTTLVGMSLGAIGGWFLGLGVGSVPGAIEGGTLGFSAGTWILEWMGLLFLAEHVGGKIYEVTRLLTLGFDEAWGSGARDWSGLSTRDMMCQEDKVPGYPEVKSAANSFALAVAVLIRLVLEGVVLYLTERGVSKLPEIVSQLKKCRLGETFAVWVEKNNQRLLHNDNFCCNADGPGVKADGFVQQTDAKSINTSQNRSIPKPRVNKLVPNPKARGPHTVFKRDPKTGKITGYTEYDPVGNPIKRFRGVGKPHGKLDPPFILEPRQGKSPGAPLKVPRPPRPDELPKGYPYEPANSY